jgi:6-phospho-beta-glucosidase
MRIVIIGGSSFSTPSLLTFLDSTKAPGPMEVVLASRSRERLGAVSRASRMLVRGDLEIRTELIETNDWRKILCGADSVIIQIRVGGFDGRLFDETFPHKYGLCGNEGLGASGLSVGWRTWPVLAPMLESIATCCPRAFVILLTSPLSPLVRASLEHTDLNLVGICELPWTTVQELGHSLGREASAVNADYLGVNHLGWFFNIRSGSRDVMDDLAGGRNSFPRSGLLRTHGCFPTRYLRMHYEPDTVLAEQTSETPRAAVLSNIQNRSYHAYGSGEPREIAAALEARATPWYTQAVGPLLLALGGQQIEIPFFLSVRNRGYVQFLAPDDIIECRHHCVDGGPLRSPLASTPPTHVIEHLMPFVEFERVATDAIMVRSVPLLRDALSLHPWTRDHAQLQSIADEIVATNDAMLMAAARYGNEDSTL